jgi:preprotein translocase subunit SecF
MFQIIKPNTNFDFIGNRHKFELVAALLLIGSILLIAVRGLNFGLDFAGGYEFQVKFPKPVKADEVAKILSDAGVAGVTVQSYGDSAGSEYLLRIEKHSGVDVKQVEAARTALRGAGDTTPMKEFTYNEEAPDRIRIAFTQDPGEAAVKDAFSKQGLNVKSVQKSPREDRAEYTVALSSIADKVEGALRSALAIPADTPVAERVEFVGPQVGAQLRTQGIKAVLYSFAFMLIYIVFRFDFYFGPVALRALFYDSIVTVGAFALTQKEFNLTTIAALLTIVGYAMNDTIVIFDRIRENNARMRGRELEQIVNASLNETLSRTILTVAVTSLVVLALMFLGGGVLADFGFALFVGFVVGTFSSISISAPLYIYLRRKFDPSLQTATAAGTPAPRTQAKA